MESRFTFLEVFEKMEKNQMSKEEYFEQKLKNILFHLMSSTSFIL